MNFKLNIALFLSLTFVILPSHKSMAEYEKDAPRKVDGASFLVPLARAKTIDELKSYYDPPHKNLPAVIFATATSEDVQCVLIEYAPFSGINTFYLYLYQLSAATDHRFEFKALDVTHDCGTFTVKRDGVNWVVKNENHEALRVFIDTPAHHDRAQVRLEKNVRHK